MKSREEWFKEASLSGDLAAPGSPFGGDRGTGDPYDNVFELGKDENGRHLAPRRMRRVPVVKFANRPEPQPREYVVEGLVPEGAATSLYGDGGVAKSMLAMSLSVSLAMGRETWMGLRIQPQAVVYLDFELTADEQHRRAVALSRGAGNGDKVPEELLYMSALGFTSEEAFGSAWELFDDSGSNLLVVDSVGLALQGEAESASDVIGWYRKCLDPFIRGGYAVLLIDHQAKGGDSYQGRTSFGSVYKRNLVRSEIQVEALDQDEGSGTLDLVFRHKKHNFGPERRPFGVQVAFGPGEIQANMLDLAPQRLATEEGTKATDRIRLAMSYMGGDVTVQELSDETNMTPKTVKNAVVQLKNSGELESLGGVGKYEKFREPSRAGAVPGPRKAGARPLVRAEEPEETGEEF